jgi:hypothetical protein
MISWSSEGIAKGGIRFIRSFHGFGNLPDHETLQASLKFLFLYNCVEKEYFAANDDHQT